MDIERARELTAGCVQTSLCRMLGTDYVPLPDVPLEELLVANRMVSESPPERIEGGMRLHTHCDPRIVALHYAYDNYGQSPEQMLEALGFELTREET